MALEGVAGILTALSMLTKINIYKLQYSNQCTLISKTYNLVNLTKDQTLEPQETLSVTPIFQ